MAQIFLSVLQNLPETQLLPELAEDSEWNQFESPPESILRLRLPSVPSVSSVSSVVHPPRMKKPRKTKKRRPRDEAAYTCPTCGESIVIPIDPSEGEEQQYTEDCPVCCNPNIIHVELFGPEEPPRIWADAE